MGEPAVFVRTFGCNLRCSWCDTKYSYDSNRYVEMSTKEIVNEILKYPQCKHIVVTGGEPLLNMQDMKDLVQWLGSYFIEIETNGTIQPSSYLKEKVSQFNVSPKLKSSLQPEKLEKTRKDFRIDFFPLEKSYFKFVLSTEEDEEELWEYLKEADKKLKERFLIMPNGASREIYLENAKKAVEFCKKYNLRFSPREHIVIFDTKRGV